MTVTIDKDLEKIKAGIRDVPDFPKPGIIFKDITPVLRDATLFRLVIDKFKEKLAGTEIDYVVCIESRGFIFGSALAYELGAGFIPVRKPNKLPHLKKSISYSLEYGQDTLEIHEDAIEKGKKVVIIDDLLATGGTAAATLELVEGLGADVVGAVFLIELEFLKGRERLSACKVTSLISYQ
jgi:adenine phosphoribosyltransferase